MGNSPADNTVEKESPHGLERIVGLERYVTSTRGVGGRAKEKTADFVVKEVFPMTPSDKGRFLIVEIEKEGWETHHLVRDISRALGISRGRISYAGVKDTRAQTTQLFSMEGVEQPRIDALNIPGVRLRVIGQRGRRIYLGEHNGNRFSILVRGCGFSGEELACNIENTTEEIGSAGGMANYFGIQRFGVQRPVNHAVGRLIVQGDLRGALMEFLTRTSTAEWEVARLAREQLASDLDFKGALEKFPLSLRYERAVLHHLATHESDWNGALAALGALGEVFVHAYQSYLFNRALSYRMRAGIGINEPLPGDSVVPLDADGIPRWKRLQNADASNTDTDFLLRRGRLAVAWPLVGTETVLPENEAAEHYHMVLEEENVTTEDFHIPFADELSSSGGWRALHAALGDFSYGLEGKEENDLRLEFFLPRGSYATVVLREYMKQDPLSMH